MGVGLGRGEGGTDKLHALCGSYNYCPTRISVMVNSGCFLLGMPAVTESRYPTYDACWVFECFHNPPNSDMDYRIFKVRTDVSARDCTRGCTDTVRESALKVDSGRKIPCRTGESKERQLVPTELHPHPYDLAKRTRECDGES